MVKGCSKRGMVYGIVYNLCGGKYQGVPLNNRIILEHIRATKNMQKYPNNALRRSLSVARRSRSREY